MAESSTGVPVTRVTKENENPLMLWAKRLAEPLAESDIAWRQSGKPSDRNGKKVAQFVAYVNAEMMRRRLDEAAAGQWELSLECLPAYSKTDKNGQVVGTWFPVKARLTVCGVAREDIGQSDKDWKAASTDAFKRAAYRFGIAHELSSALFKNVWVEVETTGYYPKPLTDPMAVYRQRRDKALRSNPARTTSSTTAAAPRFSGRSIAMPGGDDPYANPPAARPA
ncbi:MAG TPA: Rad52/Rad22 family DNA repair protein [Gemmatimonadaceae bacterium]|jgi:hypothetical protein